MLPHACDVVFLCVRAPALSNQCPLGIAEFLGAEATVVELATALQHRSIQEVVPPCSALIVHVDTLAWIAESLAQKTDDILDVIKLAPHVFVSGFKSNERHVAILQALSSGGLVGVEPMSPAESTFRVADSHRDLCRQFSGLSIRGADQTRDACFVVGVPHDRQSIMVRVGDRPFFVHVAHGKSEVFLAACTEFAHLDDIVDGQRSLLPWFSRLIPLMIFLRAALGDRTWHCDSPQACFIIDDPLLKNRYGFLDFARLLEAMARERFSTCIAFIPWNYRRSSKHIADLFMTEPGSLSLCVHGCDHTRAEFAAKSAELLGAKARLALDRMEAHRQRSQIPFDEVMVFPQGLFSSEAVSALNACGYLAAVNTDLTTADHGSTLKLRDLLGVAVTTHADFPLFGRHYPKDPAEFAFALFMGKPALVVEHHSYLENGYDTLCGFVRTLNSLDARLEWSSLASICCRACSKRINSNGEVEVRFYTNRFLLTNETSNNQTYHLLQRRLAGGPVPAVTIDGRSWHREWDGCDIKITLCLKPGQSAEVRVLAINTQNAVVSWNPTAAHKARVFIRQALFELRDNYIYTNRYLKGLLFGARNLRSRLSTVA